MVFEESSKEVDIEKILSDSRLLSEKLTLFLEEFEERCKIYRNDVTAGKNFPEHFVSFIRYNDFCFIAPEIYPELSSKKLGAEIAKAFAQQQLDKLKDEVAFAEKKWKVYEKLLCLSNGYKYSYASIQSDMLSEFDTSWELYLEPKTSNFFERMKRSHFDISESFKKDFSEEISRVIKDLLGEAHGKKFTVLSRINSEQDRLASIISELTECISIFESQIDELNKLKNTLII